MSHNQPYDQKQGMQSGGEDQYSRPRRPLPDTEARLLSDSPRATTSRQVPRSTLSADAPEFVPKSYQASGGPSQAQYTDEVDETGPNVDETESEPKEENQSVEKEQQAILLSPSAPEFVPSSGFVPRSGLLSPEACPPSQAQQQPADGFIEVFGQMNVSTADDPSNSLPLEFYNTLMILMEQPGNIPEYLPPLCKQLRKAGTEAVLHEVVDILYQQSVYSQHFQYTGARVCHFLCERLKDHPIFGQFKAVFLKRCQQDFLNREHLVKRDREGLSTICGLTLFMGELFLNVTVEQGDITERLSFLPCALTDLMLTLVAHPSDSTVKTVCQLLKLAGGLTEDSMKEKPQDAQHFSQVFSALTALKQSPQLALNMKALIESVLKFRQENWGRTPQPAPVSSPALRSMSHNYAQVNGAEPVFYNMHGKPITREEAEYGDNVGYVLNDDEQEEYLRWQAETVIYGSQMPISQANPMPTQGNHMGYDVPTSVYQPWSTEDGYGDFQPPYGYEEYAGDDGYPSYLSDTLTMDEEAEKAYEDFLNSTQGHRK